MYTYIIEGGKLEIHTPWLKDSAKVKKQVVQHAKRTFTQFDYPNGWHVEVEQTAGRFVILSNCELVQNPDGSYEAPERLNPYG